MRHFSYEKSYVDFVVQRRDQTTAPGGRRTQQL